MMESRRTFFRQSGWLVISNLVAGLFLMAVITLLSRLIPAEKMGELGIYFALLRFFTVLAIPAAGLQVIFARESAAAVTEEKRRQLRVDLTNVSRAIGLLWCVMLVICLIKRRSLVAIFQLGDSTAIWITLGLVLTQLFLPLLQGLLQGTQNFLVLGCSVLLNGVGRFAGIFLVVYFFERNATGALAGALIGLGSAVLVAFWPSRSLFRPAPGVFHPWEWMKRLMPLTCGVGSSLFLMNADILFVQSHFPKDEAKFYSAAAVVGVGLVAFATPLAAVMFPKVVRGFVQSQRTNSLQLALLGTILLGGLGALFCSIWPELPLRIMFFRTPEFLKSAVLVPWFMWGMLPLTIANVLINHVLAVGRFKAVPLLTLTAIAYGISLNHYLGHAAGMPPFAAFRGVVQLLAFFSTVLLGIALLFTIFGAENRKGGSRQTS
jgi:O-antigen/teichoic acid export membrane protein